MADKKNPVEEDLPERWDRLIRQLEDEAGLKLSNKQEHSLDQVMATIRSADATPGLASKTVDIVSKAFTCVDRFGSMIVQASSIVFGPSAQMWNAISFLIHAAKDTKAVFDNLAALMERTYIFLERLRGYLDHKTEGEKLDPQLRARFYAALDQFVRIMTLSYKLTHSWQQGDGGFRGKLKKAGGRVVAFVKVGAYGDDSGVKSAMAAFEMCVSDISGVQIDIIHRDLSDAAKNICVIEETVGKIYSNTQDIVKAVDKLGEAQASEKISERVQKSLGIDDKNVRLHVSADDEYSSMMDGTATWLFERNDYSEWEDVTKGTVSNSILSIAAPAGYGKSYLAHAIITRLNENTESWKKHQTVRTAWYYLSKDYKATDHALRHIIWELGQADTAYLRFIDKGNDKSKDLRSLKNPELWTRVVTAYGTSRPEPEVFFIVLDGLENVDDGFREDLVKVLAESQHADSVLQLRFLLTGDQSTLQQMQRDAKMTWAIVDLLPDSKTPSASLAHQRDIKRFVEQQLDRAPMFKNDTSKNTEEIKARISRELPKAARGSYTHIEQQIREINRAEDMSEVEQLLKRLDRDGKEIINEEINRLNRQLGGPRIHHLNEILAWVSVAQEALNIGTVRAVLELKFGAEGIKDPGTWVKKYCPRLLDLDSGGESGHDNLRFQPGAEEALLAAVGTREVVTGAEIDMIRAMLRTTLNRSFGDDNIFKRFEFEDFFEEKRTMQRHLVHLKPQDEASLVVLQTCLQAICDLHDDKRPEYESLREYAREYFDEHLVLAETNKVGIEDKTKLGRYLYRLLREDVVIDTWVTLQHIAGMTDWFDEGNGACAAMVALLRDPDVQRSIEIVYSTTDWLYAEEAIAAPIESILQCVARRLIQRLYDGEFDDPFWPSYWLRGYFLRAGTEDREYMKKRFGMQPTMKEVGLFESWAKPQIQNVEDGKWHFLMANFMQTLTPYMPAQRQRHLREACKRCDKAFELDPSRWAAQVLKAQILFELKDYEGCIRGYDALREKMAVGQNEEYDKVYWKKMVPGMGECQLNLKAYPEAASWFIQSYRHHLEKDEVSFEMEDVVTKLLESYRRQNEPQQAFDIIHALDAKFKDNKSWLSLMLESAYSDLHEQLIQLAHVSKSHTTIDAYYDRTIKGSGEKAKQSGARQHLEYTQGRLHLYCGDGDATRLLLPQWESIASHLRENESDCGWWTRRTLVQEYAKTWVSLSSQTAIQDQSLEEVTEKLNKFSEINNDLNTYSLYREPKLALARILFTNGKSGEAREVLEPLVRKALELARTADEASDGFERLALILPVINDDENALAAWSALLPQLPKEKDSTEGGKDLSTTDQVQNGTDELLKKIDVVVNGHVAAEPANNDELDEDAKATEDLVGTIGFGCDGACGRTWSYPDDMYVCRDCLCVQLDAGCLEKLKRGELPIMVCHQQHEHLHVPAFDVHVWKEIGDANVKVGAEYVPRGDWLAKLEMEWDVKRQELEAENAEEEKGDE